MAKATSKEQLRAQASQTDRSRFEWGYLKAREILQELQEELPGFQYEWDEELVHFRFEFPEAQMALRPFEPVRMQVVKELRRLADLFGFLADFTVDCNQSELEADNDHREKLTLEWLKGSRYSGAAHDRFAGAQS